MNTGEWLAIGLSAFFLLWFVGGAAVNRQRGHRLGERLTAGLSQLGKVETVRREKLMQSSAHLRVTGLTPPFTRLEARSRDLKQPINDTHAVFKHDQQLVVGLCGDVLLLHCRQDVQHFRERLGGGCP